MKEFERLKNVLSEELGIDKEAVTLDTSFVDDLGADSLDIAELIIGLENEFGIDIRDEDVESMITTGDALRYIKQRL